MNTFQRVLYRLRIWFLNHPIPTEGIVRKDDREDKVVHRFMSLVIFGLLGLAIFGLTLME